MLGTERVHAELSIRITVFCTPPDTLTLDLSVVRWVFHKLEAELTTFELFKTPVDQLLELICIARARDIGLGALPLPLAEPPVPQAT